jgi:hypothetical protein
MISFMKSGFVVFITLFCFVGFCCCGCAAFNSREKPVGRLNQVPDVDKDSMMEIAPLMLRRKLGVGRLDKLNYKYHTVQKGETVYAISRKYGVKPQAIIAVNKLGKGGTIVVGQKLLIIFDKNFSVSPTVNSDNRVNSRMVREVRGK